ncbi:hypothetical protein C8J56DRAFT_728195, partial [Mycena floridula]
PDELKAWISNSRTCITRPVVAHTKPFELNWWDWWNSLQPDWWVYRMYSKTPDASSLYGIDWSAFRFPGKNRMASVMGTLHWWGIAVSGKDVAWLKLLAWEGAIDDVQWIM